MIQLSRRDAEIYIPDGSNAQQALASATHLAVAAHPDDVEIIAISGILECYEQKDMGFAAAVVTNGAGSPRSGAYALCTDAEMVAVRREEQKHAAALGGYSACVLMGHESAVVKNAAARDVVEDIKALLVAARPRIVYTHNLADKHDTHVAVALRTLAAIRELPPEFRPQKLYACEVWRSLDWVNDGEKAVLDASGHPDLSAALLGAFKSQVSGGKRYDLAAAGRRVANATFFASHAVDKMDAATYALDMSALMEGGDPAAFIAAVIRRFADDVAGRIRSVSTESGE